MRASPSRAPRGELPLRRLASLGLVLCALAGIAVTQPGLWALIGTVVVVLSVGWRQGFYRRDLITELLAIAVGVTAVDYLAWRVGVANWAGWAIAAPLLAAEIFGAVHTLGMQYTAWPTVSPRLRPTAEPTGQPIFVFIPTVGESSEVLTPTIQGALAARRRFLTAFPNARVIVVVCNDARAAGNGEWLRVEGLARSLGAACVTRPVSGGNKAGNLEYARQQLNVTDDALLAIFDADQIAKPEFLIKTVPHFADPTVGWVQTGQYYRNLEQPVARWAHDQQALFYRVLCPGKAAQNAAFICGTNVVIRASALDEIGGLPQESVTEDFAASIQLHARWRSVYLTEVLAQGLGPMDLPAFLRQQRRWAIGTIGVLRTHWRSIFLPKRDGLRLEQRIQYLLACTHYLCGLRDLIYIISPLAFLVTGIPAVRTATLALFLWHFMPYLAASQAAFWYAARRHTSLRGVIMGFGSFPVLIQALLTVVLGRHSGFLVTSKQRRDGRSWRHLTIYTVAMLCCLVAIIVALADRRLRPESVKITILWVLYDVAMLGSFIWLGVQDLRFSEAHPGRRTFEQMAARMDEAILRGTRAAGPLVAPLKPAWTWQPLGLRWSFSGLGFQRAATAGGLLVLLLGAIPGLSSAGSPEHVSLPAARAPGQPPELGLSLPRPILMTRPGVLESSLCLPFTVIGRTQDLSDSFDTTWASQLSGRGQIPWITLQFGNFGPDGPPLDASLPAILNRLRDGDLRRWAQEVHSYGKPVYLTILLHVDRNWSVSSAVTNGGIPEDVPRVWEHVQSIFKAAGDTNVVWVWSPADPAHDQAYAPPDSTIDLVLQSMIRYPGTPWPDPDKVLHAVGERYPTKPLLVEASAAGPPAEKAVWLEEVATAVAEDTQVNALLYHEASPDIHAIATENARWILESDASSLHAMRAWQALLPTERLPCRSSGLSGAVGT